MRTLLNKTARTERGFSLVELMVGMAIGLIGITIITHLYLTNEKYKRSTTGSGTAQVNGALALYTLERDIRASGYGINHSALLGCTCVGAGCSPLRYYYNGVYSFPPAAAAVANRPPLMPAPVVIASTAGTPDTITVLSSGDNEAAVPIVMTENMGTAGASFKLDGTANYREPGGASPVWLTPNGYFLIVAQAGTCSLARATNITASSSNIDHTSASLWNPNAGGTLPMYSAGANVFNLGITPVWRTYSVLTTANAYKLQVVDVMRVIDNTAATPLQIVDDIVDIQAEYGRDANADGRVADTEWSPTPPASAVEWQQVLAIRVGVLARSGNYERPDPPGGACAATTATPTWTGSWVAGTFPPGTVKPESAFTVPGGLPSCYKFRVFETVIPLRNMIWRQS
jgi:type IV pilus assembly protein PilW